MTKRRRGRPRLDRKPKIVNVKLRLYPGEDDDLIKFLDGTPPRRTASAVKAAMRSGGLDLVEIEDIVDDDDLTESLGDLLY